MVLLPTPYGSRPTIIVAVTSLIDWTRCATPWHDRADALSLLATAGGVMLLGVRRAGGDALAGHHRLAQHPPAYRGGGPPAGHAALSQRGALRGADRARPAGRAGRRNLFFANATVVEDRIGPCWHATLSVRRVVLICSSHPTRSDATALGVLTRWSATWPRGASGFR